MTPLMVVMCDVVFMCATSLFAFVACSVATETIVKLKMRGAWMCVPATLFHAQALLLFGYAYDGRASIMARAWPLAHFQVQSVVAEKTLYIYSLVTADGIPTAWACSSPPAHAAAACPGVGARFCAWQDPSDPAHLVMNKLPLVFVATTAMYMVALIHMMLFIKTTAQSKKRLVNQEKNNEELLSFV